MTTLTTSSTMTPSLDLPPTQNTAPVLEFRCLYTPDLRRKQKRWQDGRLKFHAFNKRVMVYDERSNFVGDTHWRDAADFDEGEELELERGGILVQVGECVGRRDQDLFELVEKRVKERKDRAAAKNATRSPSRSPGSFASLRDTATPLRGSHLGPKPLNAVIGTPTGHYGRAMVRTTSAFEERQRLKSNIDIGNKNHRSAKRRKNSNPEPKHSYAQNLMGARLTLSATKTQSTAAARDEKICERPPSKRLRAESIDLTIDGDIVGDNLERSQTVAREELASAQVTANMQRRNTIYSTEGGAYANKLSGPPLTLFAPRVLLSAGVSKRQADKDQCQAKMTAAEGVGAERANRPEILMSPISVEEGENFPFKKVKSLVTSRRTSRLPSPLVGDGVAVVAEHAESCHTFAPEQIPKQSVSALRIKARPPPKMMMLMGRVNSRSQVSIDCSNKFTAKKTRRMAQNPDGFGASHATLHSSLFCQRQEKCLRARLNAKQLDTDQEETSSQVAGINEQTNDDHFVHAETLAENARCVIHSAASPNPPRRKSASSFEAFREEIGQTAVAKTMRPLINSTQATLELHLDVPIAPINEIIKPVSNTSTLLRDVGVVSSGREVLYDQLSFGKTSSLRPCSSVSGVSTVVLSHFRAPPSASDTTSIMKANLDVKCIDVISEHAIAAPVTGVPELGRSFCNSIPSVTQEMNTLDAAVQMKEPPRTTRTLRHPKVDMSSSGIEVMPSPKLSPALGKTSTSQTPSKERPDASWVSLSSSVRCEIPVQAISAVMASTTNITLPPPPLRLLHRPRNTPAAGDAPKTKPLRGPADVITIGGPWSRESFDLFGEWRPA